VSASAPTALEQAISAGGIKSVNFFNGRLLTGEDLSSEQDANAIARMRIGQTIGSGVACGLDLAESTSASTNERPVLTVEAGLALSRSGRVLELPVRTDLALTRDPITGATTSGLVFSDCTPLQPGTYTAGAGVYLLTIGPSQTREGRAPTSGLGNVGATCASAYLVEGVQFRLIQLTIPPDIASAQPLLQRNRLAHLAFGTADTRRLEYGTSPFTANAQVYGLLDDLRAVACFGDDEVPLAILSWTSADGLRYVDLWAVRRRITAPSSEMRWPTLLGDRRRSEAEARFLQFEQQVEDMLQTVDPLSATLAADAFEYLPPVGLLPIAGTGSLRGFDPNAFFGSQASTDLAPLEARSLASLLFESLDHEPIAVGTTERIQRYLLWDNTQAVANGVADQLVLVFAKQTLPYCGTARFGQARWGISRFAPRVI